MHIKNFFKLFQRSFPIKEIQSDWQEEKQTVPKAGYFASISAVCGKEKFLHKKNSMIKKYDGQYNWFFSTRFKQVFKLLNRYLN